MHGGEEPGQGEADLDAMRRQSYKRFTAALDALRNDNRDAVRQYLREIQQAHGRAVAERTRDTLHACLQSPAWASPPPP